jgi:hypothetical protein
MPLSRSSIAFLTIGARSSESVAPKIEFRSLIQADPADHAENQNFSSVFQKNMIVCARPDSTRRGVSANRHERGKQGAMDVSVARGERLTMRTAKACGPGSPMLGSSPKAKAFERRWQEKPGHRGERAISRKPSRRECRIVAAYL